MQSKTEKLQITPDALKYTSGSTLPIWTHKVPSFGKFSTLNQNVNADVCVVGAGLAGLTTAYLLNKLGKSVVILEAREVCSGETGRTTAHLVSGVDDHYFEIVKSHGAEAAKHVAEAHCAAIDLIEKIAKDENIDCEFERVDGYLFLAPEHTQEFLEKELFAAREAGMNVEMARVPFPEGSIEHGNAVKFANQGQFHPTKYVKGLLDVCVKNGVRVFTNSPAVSFKEGDTTVTTTQNGNQVTANHLVMASNLPVNDTVTMYTKVEPYRSYVITAKIPKGSVKRALFWSTSDPYVYARVTDGDDDKSDFLIVGGEDHYTGQKTDYEQRYNNLITWTKERFPIIETIVSKWSGQVVEPVDDLAFLGRNPGSTPNVYLITGDSGNGMTHTQIGAMIIQDFVQGKDNRWAKTFDPSRLMTNEKTEFIKHNLHVQSQYLSWVTPGEIKDIEDLKPGCGGILRHGAHKVACYRDDGGKLHAHSAVCTHLAAIVNWNSEEKSFDCPCHGSRFDAYGFPINGPAVRPLAEVDISKL